MKNKSKKLIILTLILIIVLAIIGTVVFVRSNQKLQEDNRNVGSLKSVVAEMDQQWAENGKLPESINTSAEVSYRLSGDDSTAQICSQFAYSRQGESDTALPSLTQRWHAVTSKGRDYVNPGLREQLDFARHEQGKYCFEVLYKPFPV